MRLAIHAGEVGHDEHGVGGMSVVHAFRLLDDEDLEAAIDEAADRLVPD